MQPRQAASTRPTPPPAASTAARRLDGVVELGRASAWHRVLCAIGRRTPSSESGGADGGGFIRSAYTGVVGAMALAGTTTGGLAEPEPSPMTGRMVKSPEPSSFELDRRASVDQLLAVAGNSADYSVRLIDVSAGGEAI